MPQPDHAAEARARLLEDKAKQDAMRAVEDARDTERLKLEQKDAAKRRAILEAMKTGKPVGASVREAIERG